MPAGWRQVQAVQGALDGKGTVALVELMEEDLPANRSSVGVDPMAIPGNTNRRRLRVQYVDGTGQGGLTRVELPFPSRTIPGDPCSVRDLEALSVRHHRVVVSVHHEQACGSGSGGDSTFRFVLVEDLLRLEVFETTHGSRDGDTRLHLDYGSGMLTRSRDAPDFDAPVVKRTRLPRPLQWPLITQVSLTRCPPPLANRPLPDCR